MQIRKRKKDVYIGTRFYFPHFNLSHRDLFFFSSFLFLYVPFFLTFFNSFFISYLSVRYVRVMKMFLETCGATNYHSELPREVPSWL